MRSGHNATQPNCRLRAGSELLWPIWPIYRLVGYMIYDMQL